MPALSGMPEITEVITVDSQRLGLRQHISLAHRLGKKKFSASITVTEKICGYLIPFMAKIPVRIGFSPGITQPFKAVMCRYLSTHRVFYGNDPAHTTGEHEVERQGRLLTAFGIDEKPGPLKVSIDDEAKEWVRERLGASRNSSCPHLVALHLSDKWLQDGWDMEALEDLLQKISARAGTQILVTYGEKERLWAGPFLENEKGNPAVIPFFDPSFQRWAAALQTSMVLVTMDTSASHVASALGIPVIDVFPANYFAHTSSRWYPWRVEHRLVERRSLPASSDQQERSRIRQELDARIIKYLDELLKGGNEQV